MGSGLLAETHSVVPPKLKGEPLPRSLLGPRQLAACQPWHPSCIRNGPNDLVNSHTFSGLFLLL